MKTSESQGARQVFRLVITLLLPVVLIVVLTACGLSGGTPSTDFQAGAGTLNFSNGPGFSLMLTYNLREVPADNEIDIVITGPPGWNDDQPITSTATFVSTGQKWSWRNIFRGSDGEYLTVESGTYTVESTFNGRMYARHLTIDSSDRLATVESLDISASETEVTINWGPVPSAQSYQVELWSVDDSLPRGTYSTMVTSSNHTFSDLALQIDGHYSVAVQAMSVDFTAPSPEVPEGQFNMSFAASSFTFTSGSLQRQSMAVEDFGSMAQPAEPGEGADELPILSDADTALLVSMARQSPEGMIAQRATSGSGSKLRWDRSVAIANDEIAVLAVSIEDYPALAQFAFVDGSLASATLIRVLGDGKVPVCHTPPGNPDAQHTILVDLPALRAHYIHGDTIAYCQDVTGQTSSGIDLAIVDLTDGTTTINHYSPAGDTIIAIGPWTGSSTVEELATPVPVPAEPEWIASAVADINYTGPVPGTQAFWTAGAEEDLDDGGGGSDGKSGDDDPDGGNDGSEVGGGGDGDDGADGENEVSTCDWNYLVNLQLRVEFAQDNYVEVGVGGREKAEMNLARTRKQGFAVISVSTLIATATTTPVGGLTTAVTSTFAFTMAEQFAIDDLAAARAKEAELEIKRNAALADRIQYYGERNCAEIASEHVGAVGDSIRPVVRLGAPVIWRFDVPLTSRIELGGRIPWMRTFS
jgi:hypothetical protein